MAPQLTLFHGTTGDSILSIMDSRVMRPDASREIYFSEQLSDALQHGADLRRRQTFAIKVAVSLPLGATSSRTSLHGNPRAVVVTSTLPVPVTVTEMYVRLPRKAQTTTVRGWDAIRSYLNHPAGV